MRYKIGEIVGQYKILGYNYDKNYGTTYVAKCLKCGYVNPSAEQSVVELKGKVCRHTRHQWTSYSLQRKFYDMKKRCHNPNHKDYMNYGGRGIKICDEWLQNPIKFETWALNNGYKEGLEIDRIDNDKGYSPDNCRWVTRKFNMLHKRANTYYTVKGETMLAWFWVQRLGLPNSYIYRLRDKGFTKEEIEQRLTDIIDGKYVHIRQKQGKKRYVTIDGVTHRLTKWAKILGIDKQKLAGKWCYGGREACTKYIKSILAERNKNRGPLVVKLGSPLVIKLGSNW